MYVTKYKSLARTKTSYRLCENRAVLDVRLLMPALILCHNETSITFALLFTRTDDP